MKKPLVRAKYLYRKGKEALEGHLVDSAGLVTVANPVYGFFETVNIPFLKEGMSYDNSVNARKIGTILTFAGLGWVYAKGMDISRKLFKVDVEKRARHDALYGLAYNLAISPFFYLAAGERDPTKLAWGTVTACGIGLFLGSPAGYAVDAFRDFFGFEKSERLPPIVGNRSRAFKIGLAGLLVAASVEATSLVYKLTIDENARKSQITSVERELGTEEGIVRD